MFKRATRTVSLWTRKIGATNTLAAFQKLEVVKLANSGILNYHTSTLNQNGIIIIAETQQMMMVEIGVIQLNPERDGNIAHK